MPLEEKIHPANLISDQPDPVQVDTGVNASTPQEYVAKKIQRGKSYYKTTVFVTGLLYLFNFTLLYFGTIYGEERINVSKFYGFKEGRHEHLQRTSGVFMLIMFLVNMLPLLKDEEHGKNSMLAFSALCNIIVITHYILETLYYVGMRLEVIAIEGFVLALNMYWSVVDFHQRRKAKILAGRDPEEAHEDKSVRKTIRGRVPLSDRDVEIKSTTA